MHNQLNEINNVIRFMIDYLNNNQDARITKEMIFDYLINYNVDPKYASKIVEGKNIITILKALDYNTKDFKAEYSISRMYDEHQEFRIVKKYLNTNNNYQDFKYQIILGIDHDKYAKTVCKLIYYLINNNINAIGKISYTYRSDSLIINLVNTNDLKSVVNYINHSLNDSLIYPNPFIPRYSKVGIIVNHNNETDYNYTQNIAKYLEKYLSYINSSDLLDKASANHFAQYINFYQKRLADSLDINELKIINQSLSNIIVPKAEEKNNQK